MKLQYAHKFIKNLRKVLPSLHYDYVLRRISFSSNRTLSVCFKNSEGHTVKLDYNRVEATTKDFGEGNDILSRTDRLELFNFIENLYNNIEVKQHLSFTINDENSAVCYVDGFSVPQNVDQHLMILSKRFVEQLKK